MKTFTVSIAAALAALILWHATTIPRREIPAMNQVMKRSETAKETMWKLEDLFPGQDAWNEEYAKVKALVGEVAGFQGKLTDADAIARCFALEDEISMHTERLYVYANMRHHEDTAEPTYQALSDKSRKLSVEVSEALSFITPEILGLS